MAFAFGKIVPAGAAIALGLGIATPATAEWYRAESDHFVVYADDRAKDVQIFGEQLEQYHQALLLLTGYEDVIPSPSNRLTVFVVGSERTIEKLVGEGGRNVAGFYIPRAGSSRAFVPDIRLSSRETDFSMIVLMHEYAHHFLLSTTRFAMPRWYDEGAAEFFASARFDRDGSLWIGLPAQHRANELAYATEVKLRELLDHELFEKRGGKDQGNFYGRAWALFHYLIFEDSRSGQLKAYVNAIAAGKPVTVAAREAFGDIDVLQRELDRYLRQARMPTYKLPPERMNPGKVSVAPLSEGEGAVMPFRIISQRGVDRTKAEMVLKDIREVAARYPNDAGVLAALAEAEFDAGNDDAAIAAADRAIALDKTRTNAYVQKGYAMFRKASDAAPEASEAAFTRAMAPFRALNRIEADHPAPLIFFYRSFVERGAEPDELARHALERAAELAPFDKPLAFQAAMMQAGEGKIAIARAGLAAIAANPHGGQLAKVAAVFRDAMSDAAEGEPWHFAAADQLSVGMAQPVVEGD